MRRQKKILSEERIARRLWNVKIVNIFIIFWLSRSEYCREMQVEEISPLKISLQEKGVLELIKTWLSLYLINVTLGS